MKIAQRKAEARDAKAAAEAAEATVDTHTRAAGEARDAISAEGDAISPARRRWSQCRGTCVTTTSHIILEGVQGLGPGPYRGLGPYRG